MISMQVSGDFDTLFDFVNEIGKNLDARNPHGCGIGIEYSVRKENGKTVLAYEASAFSDTHSGSVEVDLPEPGVHFREALEDSYSDARIREGSTERSYS